MAYGLVMMKVDAFAFGGGFASVPLMYQEVVAARNWMPATAFMDGIALGQVTPGPIVITATFVGYQVAGLVGAAVGTVFIFLPSLLVLVDHLLRGHKLGKRGLPGSETELSTHLEVAIAVAEGRADVGVGTLAPARSLGLEFVHLTWERYDLLSTDEAFYRKPTQAFFEMVKSDWLRQLIARLPGYNASETGLLTVVQPDT
jgi:hypothetical protein